MFSHWTKVFCPSCSASALFARYGSGDFSGLIQLFKAPWPWISLSESSSRFIIDDLPLFIRVPFRTSPRIQSGWKSLHNLLVHGINHGKKPLIRKR